MKKYIVRLETEKREWLSNLVRAGKVFALRIRHANVLARWTLKLLADRVVRLNILMERHSQSIVRRTRRPVYIHWFPCFSVNISVSSCT
jgi:hypothetical protein